ncbi:SGNH/GDSL hydrolase family protein [soil metagenome]
MQDVELQDGPVAFVGALDVERSATGWQPRRLPAWTRPQIPDLFMEAMVQMPSGVRVRFSTDATAIELDVMLTLIRQLPKDLAPAWFDLVVDGDLAGQQPTTEGHVINLSSLDPGDISFAAGEPTTIRFEGLAPGSKVVEVWLPQASSVEVRAVRVDDGATVAAAPASAARRWVHHGSSISHCMEAASPTRTWPAVAAHDAGVELLSLGFGGQCMLDPFVARTIRDAPADVISLKVGINIVNGDTMRDRTFGPAVHGFLDTIREGHPDTPILLVSPIFCPSAEDHPGPNVVSPDGKFVTVAGSEEIRQTCLTLRKVRAQLAAIVELRQAQGDAHLSYLDGLGLFGPQDADDLPDDLHPNAEGYVRMGHRFAEQAFGPGGALAP